MGFRGGAMPYMGAGHGKGWDSSAGEYEPWAVQNFQAAADAVQEQGTSRIQQLLQEALATGNMPAPHVVHAAVEGVGEGIRSAYVEHVQNVPVAQGENGGMSSNSESRDCDADIL